MVSKVPDIDVIESRSNNVFCIPLIDDDISTFDSLDQGYSNYMIVMTSSTTPAPLYYFMWSYMVRL